MPPPAPIWRRNQRLFALHSSSDAFILSHRQVRVVARPAGEAGGDAGAQVRRRQSAPRRPHHPARVPPLQAGAQVRGHHGHGQGRKAAEPAAGHGRRRRAAGVVAVAPLLSAGRAPAAGVRAARAAAAPQRLRAVRRGRLRRRARHQEQFRRPLQGPQH